jgi:MFS family permease
LIPGLLIAAPLSDARGRRYVVVPAAVLSLAASSVLALGADTVALLYLGRFLAGISSGVVFGAGTAWLREASAADGERASARRAAVAMTSGFTLGPLVAGLLAQWGPDPRVVAYLPHIVLMVAVLFALAGAEETVAGRRGVHFAIRGFGNSRFRRVVAPMAPWVFAAPAIAFALLPDVVDAGNATDGIALVAVVSSLTAFAGILIQPLARRLGDEGRLNLAALTGLLVLTAALAAGALTAATGAVWLLLPDALLFGAAYGLCMVAGLLEVGRLAPAGELGAYTATYYALTYLGFGAPYLFALAHGPLSYPALLAIAAGLALVTAAVVARPPVGEEAA